MRFTMMLTYFGVILLVLVLMTVYILGNLGDRMIAQEKTDLYTKASTIADTAVYYIDTGNTAEMDRIIMQTLAGTNIRGIVIDSSYTVIFDTNKDAKLIGKTFMRKVMKSALIGERMSDVFKNDVDSSSSIVVAVPVKYNNTVTGAVYLQNSVDYIDRTVKYIKKSLIFFSIFISLLAGVMSMGISIAVTSPIDEFISVAREISKGNFSKRIKVRGHSELAQMAQAMNYMCGELEQLEENRRKFVSDASHELKTPLATIKLISDSLVSTENPDIYIVRDFLGDLSEEVDRLTRIINKLLALTKMENRKTSLNLEYINIADLVTKVIKKLTVTAKNKNIYLHADGDISSPIETMADFDKLTEVIYNITDNAIKYTDSGGEVTVGVSATGENVTVKIADNGPGIPDSEKDKIFERFYRLDDSRARDTGGTGLGLAIAREAVLMHGGKIEVISSVGKGTTFLVIIPKKNAD